MQKYNKYFDYPLFSCNFVAVKLSVIIPIYRVEATLNRCVESVVGQTFHDMEVIVVDDGSPDRCPQMCDEWARRDSRIRVIHKQNGGLSDARNAGLDAARGDYVTFVDSDDYLFKETYKRVMAEVDDADLVEYPLVRFFNSPREEYVNIPKSVYTDMREYWLGAFAYEHCYAWNKVYRRSLFDGVRYPAGRVFEDVATLPLLLRKAHKVRTTDCGLYFYCANDNGITATATGQELQMLLESHLEVIKHWCDSRYYMHVVNIQLDVCHALGVKPRLGRRWVSPCAAHLAPAQRIKALAIDLFGIKGLCKLDKIVKGGRS